MGQTGCKLSHVLMQYRWTRDEAYRILCFQAF